MKNKKIKILNLLLSLIGLSLISIEIYLNFKNGTLCKNKGCILVHTLDTYLILNYLGFLIFFYFFIVSVLDFVNFYFGFLFKLKTYLLCLCVIVEGYFIGFQMWSLKEYCYYCLIIASIIFLSFLLDYIYPEKERNIFSLEIVKNTLPYKLGILGFFSLLIASYLVKFPINSLNLNSPIIFYKNNCPYCEQIINYAKEKEIKVKFYKVEKFIPFLKTLNLNSVPILIYKENGKIFILNGFKEIKEWLDSKENKLEIQKGKETSFIKREIRIRKESEFNVTQPLNKIGVTNEEETCTTEKPCE